MRGLGRHLKMSFWPTPQKYDKNMTHRASDLN